MGRIFKEFCKTFFRVLYSMNDLKIKSHKMHAFYNHTYVLFFFFFLLGKTSKPTCKDGHKVVLKSNEHSSLWSLGGVGG